MTENNKNFYFQGKFFETFDEMLEYYKIWEQSKLDEKTAKEMTDKIMEQILVNVFLYSEFTNKEFNEYLQKTFDFSMNLLHNGDPKK